MKNTELHLAEAQKLAEAIALEIYEAGFATEEQYAGLIELAHTKIADRIVVFGDVIRDKARAVYVEAAKEAEL